MTDGPFKNLKLDRSSNRFVEAVQNDAVSHGIRCALANNAILRGLLYENESVIRALQDCGQSAQLALNNRELVKAIFNNHLKSDFSDQLSREINFRLHLGDQLGQAVNNGLQSSLEAGICGFRTRIQEACLERQRDANVPQSQLERVLDRSNQVLDNINRTRILRGLKDGNKDEFKQDIKKKNGIDDGPPL